MMTLPRMTRGVRPGRTARALPVAGALSAIVLIGAIVFPSFRHQLSVSFVRQPNRYVELYFADVAAARGCPVTGGQIGLDVVVRSHLADAQALPYQVTVTAADGTVTGRSSGQVQTSPGTDAHIPAAARVPARRTYDVDIALVGRSERLSLHCGTGGWR